MTLANAGLYGPEAILGQTGVPATNTPVTVYLHNTTTAATLYSDNTKASTAANPVNTSSLGDLWFYVAPGLYDLSFTVGGVATTLTVVVAPWFTDAGYRVAQIIETCEAALSGAGTLIDSAWFLCDGTAVSRATYSDLFTALGGAATPWGTGDGSTTFNVPDLRGRSLFGAGSVGTNAQPTYAIGTGGGEQNHLLVTGEMPTHSHTTDVEGDNAMVAILSGTQFAAASGSQAISASSSPNTGNAGGGTSHNNMPPFAIVQYLIKAI